MVEALATVLLMHIKSMGKHRAKLKYFRHWLSALNYNNP